MNLIEEEMRLEELMSDMGVKRYDDKRTKAEAGKGGLDNLDPYRKLLTDSLASLRGPMLLHLAKGLTNPMTAKQLSFLQDFKVETLCYITLRTMLVASDGNTNIQSLCRQLCKILVHEKNYQDFLKEAPGYAKKVLKSLTTSHEAHRLEVISFARKRIGLDDFSIAPHTQFIIGKYLIDCVLQHATVPSKSGEPIPLFVFGSSQRSMKASKTPMKVLRFNSTIEEWLENAHALCAKMRPVTLPMVIRPVSWEKGRGGGFLKSKLTNRGGMVRSRHKAVQDVVTNTEMPRVYQALDIVQGTAWAINEDVLRLMEVCQHTGRGKLPLPDRALELPPKFWTSDEELERIKAEDEKAIEEWKAVHGEGVCSIRMPENRFIAWKRKASNVHDTWFKETGQRVALAFKIQTANDFLKYDRFYFPWNMDYRSRLYPLVNWLSPQSDDSGKALLKFADGKPLGERGAYWLAVHGANCFGVDKVSFEERVAWVRDHESEILDSAENPLDGQRFWEQADDPFKFYAFAREWAGYKREGVSFVSHLPIAMDGTCNGLQHFSALLRDPVGAVATNLEPGVKPSDIYGLVADVVNQHLEGDQCEEANLWRGKVGRSETKRNVMTLPYGATLQGFIKQVMQHLDKLEAEHKTPYLGKDVNTYHAAKYLATLNRESIKKVVVAAITAMEWIQKAFGTAALANKELTWTTPIGFKAVQLKLKSKAIRIDTSWGGTRIRMNLQEDKPGEVDKAGMVSGSAPNFIHSLDASHLMMTVLWAFEKHGIDGFALIHDSYGTWACDTDALHQCIREAFVEMYADTNLLEGLYQELVAQLPADIAARIEPPPEQLGWDVRRVQDSPYFFA